MINRRTAIVSVVLSLTSVTCLHASGAPEDQAFQQQLFGRLLGKDKAHACFRRVYDAGHLGRHPGQNVQTMMVLVTGDPGNGGTSEPNYQVGLNVSFRKVGKHFETVGNCGSLHRAAGEGGTAAAVHCGVECDGGSIDVSLKSTASVLVGIPEHARIWPAGTDMEDDSGPSRKRFGPDDKLFLLRRARLTDCLGLASERSDKAAMERGR